MKNWILIALKKQYLILDSDIITLIIIEIFLFERFQKVLL
jgi:hypothetical protein